jgi:hypothetical protein
VSELEEVSASAKHKGVSCLSIVVQAETSTDNHVEKDQLEHQIDKYREQITHTTQFATSIYEYVEYIAGCIQNWRDSQDTDCTVLMQEDEAD